MNFPYLMLYAVVRFIETMAEEGQKRRKKLKAFCVLAMGKCSVYSSLQANSKVKFAVWPTSWRPPGADGLSSRWLKWTLACRWRRIDSTINIVLGI